jgi:hypothetical protein
MASESLLAALHENYGLTDYVVDDVTTVRGLLSFCKRWPQGLLNPEALNNPCFSMAGQLRAASARMEQDLEDNPTMAEAMRAPLRRTANAYQIIARLLEQLPELAMQGDLREFKDHLEEFEQERLAVLEAQEQMEVQLHGPLPVCPRCGSSGEHPDCEPCMLTRLYPDTHALRAESQADRVRGLYANVFGTYLRVVKGERSLRVLLSHLVQLEEHLESLLHTRKQATRRLDAGQLGGRRREEALVTEAVLLEAEQDIKLALQGIETMREAEKSLRVYDLSRGWDDIFHASQSIEMTTARIRREMMEEGEENDPLPEWAPPSRGTSDQVAFSEEE